MDGHLGLVQISFQASELRLDPLKVPLGPVHVHVGLGLEFAHPGVFVREAPAVHLRGLEMARIEDLDPEMILEELSAHCDAA